MTSDYHAAPTSDEARAAVRDGATGLELPGAFLAGANLERAVITGGDLSGANLRGAKLAGAELTGVNLRRARLEGADLRGARLTGCNLELAVLGGARLDEATLTSVNLSRSNLVGASARGARLTGCDMFYSRPGSADFSRAELTDVNIQRAIFRAADMRGMVKNQVAGTPTLDRALTEFDPIDKPEWSFDTDPADCPATPPLLLRAFLLPEVNEANVYIVACPETRQAALIDAGGFSQKVVDYVTDNSLSVDLIFITHAHYDHTGGLAQYMEAFGTPRVLCAGPIAGVDTEIVTDGNTVEIGNLEGVGADTSGHTEDSTSLLLGQIAFTGDALFAGSIGGTNSDDNQRRECDNIRARLFTLPDATELYSGHGPASTVLIEQRHNPFFT